MFSDEHGAGVMVERGLDTSDAVIEQARDVGMIRFRARGMTYRAIGRYFGLSPQAVQQRIARLPADVREHYRKKPMGWLDSA